MKGCTGSTGQRVIARPAIERVISATTLDESPLDVPASLSALLLPSICIANLLVVTLASIEPRSFKYAQ